MARGGRKQSDEDERSKPGSEVKKAFWETKSSANLEAREARLDAVAPQHEKTSQVSLDRRGHVAKNEPPHTTADAPPTKKEKTTRAARDSPHLQTPQT